MDKYLKLLEDELYRSKGFYFLLVAAISLLQLLNAIVLLWTYNPEESYIGSSQTLTLLDLTEANMVYFLIIGGAIMAMLLYSVFIWIRDWYFQGNYIYRLLSLPGNRMSIFLAKLTAILLMIVGLLLLQTILLMVMNGIGSLYDYYQVIPWTQLFAQQLTLNYVLSPLNWQTGFFTYGIGTLGLIILYNLVVILLSHRYHRGSLTVCFVLVYSQLSFLLLLGGLYLVFIAWPLTLMETQLALTLLILALGSIHLSISYYLMHHYISI